MIDLPLPARLYRSDESEMIARMIEDSGSPKLAEYIRELGEEITRLDELANPMFEEEIYSEDDEKERVRQVEGIVQALKIIEKSPRKSLKDKTAIIEAVEHTLKEAL